MFDFMPIAAGNHGEDIVLLLGALALDVVLGLLPGLARLAPERLRVFHAITLFFDSRLNRKGRSEANLLVRGAVVTAIMVLIAVAAGIALDRYARMIPYGWVVEFAVLVVCLSSRRMFLDLRRGLQVLGTEDLAAGQDMVARWTGRDASRLDKFGVARILVELAAVAVGRRVVIPAFWFVLLGFPGLFVSRAVSRLAIAAAGRDAATRAFGAVAMRLDHVLGLLPSYLGAGLLSLAALVVPRASVRRGFEIMSLDAMRDEIVNDGRFKGAAAGALGLALGGPFGTRGSGGVRDAWIGNGRARVGQSDVRRMFYLATVALLLVLALAAALTALRL